MNSHLPDWQTLPAVATAPNGDFTVVWTSNWQDGSHAGIFGQRFVPPANDNQLDVFARRFSASLGDEPCVATSGKLSCDTGRSGGELEVQHGFRTGEKSGDRPALLQSAAMSERRFRILIAKPGLDGHDRGAKVVARALRDAGYEVIYTGLRQTPEQIAAAAVQEDVDAVGLSILSGAHNALLPEITRLLKEQGADDILVFAGGIIPEQDIPGLKTAGIDAIFLPGTSTRDIVQYLQGRLAA